MAVIAKQIFKWKNLNAKPVWLLAKNIILEITFSVYHLALGEWPLCFSYILKAQKLIGKKNLTSNESTFGDNVQVNIQSPMFCGFCFRKLYIDWADSGLSNWRIAFGEEKERDE